MLLALGGITQQAINAAGAWVHFRLVSIERRLLVFERQLILNLVGDLLLYFGRKLRWPSGDGRCSVNLTGFLVRGIVRLQIRRDHVVG